MKITYICEKCKKKKEGHAVRVVKDGDAYLYCKECSNELYDNLVDDQVRRSVK